MKYSDLKSSISAMLAHDNNTVVHVQSSPGTGKTSLAIDVAREYLAARGVPEDMIDSRIWVFRPSIHDPVDLLGVPTTKQGVTTWCPPEMLHKLRAGTGPGFIIYDELAQAPTMMQNAIAGLLLDRMIGELHLDHEVAQMSTGNRAEDKAGAGRLMTQMGNRMCIVEMDVSLDDVTSYYMDKGVDPMGIAFLRMRPGLLNGFDPNRATNPTPRSWERLLTGVPSTLPTHQYLAIAQGIVGEGAAMEWVAAKDIMASMPNPDFCIMQPTQAEVPEKPAVQHAITTALAMKTEAGNFGRVYTYIQRLPRERQVVYMLDVVRRDKSLMATREFIEFSTKNQDIFLGN